MSDHAGAADRSRHCEGGVYGASAVEGQCNNKSPHTNEPMGKKLLPALQSRHDRCHGEKRRARRQVVAWTQKLEEEKKVEGLRQRAEAGDAQAMTDLAFRYRHGKGVKEDLTAHFHWAKRAADLDYPRGMTQLAQCYLDGNGTAKNVSTGLIKLAEAATLGSEHACYVLAWVYHRGRNGVRKDSRRLNTGWENAAARRQRVRCSEPYRAEAVRWLAEAWR